MKILIIENEMPNHCHLVSLLARYNPAIEVAGPLKTTTEVTSYFANGDNADAIIAETQLDDGLIFECLDRIPLRIPIIFVTAYDQYTLRAFDYNSVHYLLKPVNYEAFAKALDKLPPRFVTDSPRVLPNAVARNRFLVRRKDSTLILRTTDVAALVLDGQAVKAYTFDGRSHVVDISLDVCEQQLDKSRFFRATRQCIVNEAAIERISDLWNGKARISITGAPELEVIMSRDKARSLRKWLDA